MAYERTAAELRLIEEEYDCPVRPNQVSFTPIQIIYRQLIVNPNNWNLSRYKDIFVPKQYRNPSSFRNLIRKIAIDQYYSPNKDEEEDCPLDISVYRNSIIIVQLPWSDIYRFKPQPVLLKKHARTGTCRHDLYGQLRFVDSRGRAHERPLPLEDSTLIYFRVAFQDGTTARPYIQPFVYDIDKAPLRLTAVDPDIRYPGNGGAPAEP